MTNRISVLAAVALLCGGPAGLAGQGLPWPGVTRGGWFVLSDHHGRIGVLVNTEASPETDSVGARLDAVTPGGPAAVAGLKAGDIITTFNGTGLGGVRAEDEDESGPGRKLIELARALAPGDTVRVEYRRGGEGEPRKATLVAEAAGPWSGMERIEPPSQLGRMTLPPFTDGVFSFCFGDAWCDMELVSLNPDLGEYFGTREGILVVRAPADSGLPLRGGDVILTIGGRKPTSASHAMRILRSYDPGETVTIDIMRKQKRMSVLWHVPTATSPMRRFVQPTPASPPPDPSDDPSES